MRRTPLTRLAHALLAACSVSLSLGGLNLAPAHAASTESATSVPAGIAWHEAQSEADVEQAFALARQNRQPVLLYWGASWCPPCNQLKATLFKRQDFIAQSRAVVAVHLDGDHAGAQKLGARFKVTGYPTLILFNPQGKELTRLPGEADARQVMQVLQLGMAGGRPVAEVLADAKAGKTLGANEWRLLGYY
ncbi:MAG: thioredoxin fold domain-containing protein, partial [Paucibacter sp.]|nr:thioredoxin fold domain-containing protein [Roseateles sp.]